MLYFRLIQIALWALFFLGSLAWAQTKQAYLMIERGQQALSQVALLISNSNPKSLSGNVFFHELSRRPFEASFKYRPLHCQPIVKPMIDFYSDTITRRNQSLFLLKLKLSSQEIEKIESDFFAEKADSSIWSSFDSWKSTCTRHLFDMIDNVVTPDRRLSRLTEAKPHQQDSENENEFFIYRMLRNLIENSNQKQRLSSPIRSLQVLANHPLIEGEMQMIPRLSFQQSELFQKVGIELIHKLATCGEWQKPTQESVSIVTSLAVRELNHNYLESLHKLLYQSLTCKNRNDLIDSYWSFVHNLLPVTAVSLKLQTKKWSKEQ